MPLVRGGYPVPCRILCDDGMWSAIIDGEPCGAPNIDPTLADGVFRIWLGRSTIISAAQYRYLIDQKAWALAYQPNHPAATPYRPIDRMRLPPVEPP